MFNIKMQFEENSNVILIDLMKKKERFGKAIIAAAQKEWKCSTINNKKICFEAIASIIIYNNNNDNGNS